MTAGAVHSGAAGREAVAPQPAGSAAPVPAATLRWGMAMVGVAALLSGGALGAVLTAFLSPLQGLLGTGTAALCAAFSAMLLWRLGATRRASALGGALGAMASVPVAAFLTMVIVAGLVRNGAPQPSLDELLILGLSAAAIATVTRIGLLTLPLAAATGVLVARWCRRRPA